MAELLRMLSCRHAEKLLFRRDSAILLLPALIPAGEEADCL